MNIIWNMEILITNLKEDAAPSASIFARVDFFIA